MDLPPFLFGMAKEGSVLSKNVLKTLSRYKQEKFRREDEVFVVEGVKLTEELLRSDFCVLLICATGEWIEENETAIREKLNAQSAAPNRRLSELERRSTETKRRFSSAKGAFIETERRLDFVRQTFVPQDCCYKDFDCVVEVSDADLERLTMLSTPNKVWCLVRRPQNVKPFCQKGLTHVLDGVSDPGNIGTIVRIDEWFAVENIICSENSVSIFNPKTVQSTMGSIFRVNVHYCNLIDFFNSLPKNLPIYASLVEKGDSVYREHLPKDAVLVIGSESHGVSPKVRELVNRNIHIPQFKIGNSPESLNAAIACAILVSEFRRNS